MRSSRNFSIKDTSNNKCSDSGGKIVRSSAFTRPLIASLKERTARGEAAVKAELQTNPFDSVIVRSVLSGRLSRWDCERAFYDVPEPITQPSDLGIVAAISAPHHGMREWSDEKWHASGFEVILT